MLFDKTGTLTVGGARLLSVEVAPGESVDDVLKDYFAKLGVPVLAHFPLGHVRYNTTLPVGAMAELDADAQTLKILENPVTLPQ